MTRDPARDGGGAPGYPAIGDHGAIGNLRTAALVATDGSIDWCCLPDLDGPSVFAAILDATRGGRFRVAPTGARLGRQRYVADTNVLETAFETDGGRVVVSDFMPLSGDLAGTRSRREEPDPDPSIVRLVRCEGAAVSLEIEWSPRFDYARTMPRIERSGGGFVARGTGDVALALAGLPTHSAASVEDDGATLRACIELQAGAELAVVTRWGSQLPSTNVGDCRHARDATERAWRGWAAGRDSSDAPALGGPWHAQIVRSGLTLKLLTHRHTGAIAAAPTTSLPEEIGGVRNWDYRYTWVRDAAFTAQAFSALGHDAEAKDWLRWAQHASKSDDPSAFDLQIMYGLHGETKLTEVDLPHLEGYRGSKPVRIGNAASEQFQLDIYGELMIAAYELTRLGHGVDPELWGFLRRVADRACERWREPDNGIWEVRTKPRHFVYSKVMAWAALDRALKLADHFTLHGEDGEFDKWRREAQAIRDAVLSQGVDPKTGAFIQAFGETHLDASTLLIPQVGFLPVEDKRVQKTIDRVLAELTENGIVYRYLSDDGIPGDEGAFGLATFWMVDALADSKREKEALDLFEGMAKRANPLGLFSEEFDPQTGELLGNFPQAFSHIGFVNAALHLQGQGKAVQQREPQ